MTKKELLLLTIANLTEEDCIYLLKILNEGKTGNKKTCHSDVECSFINRYDKCKACMKYY
jgi:hypothetical protein